MPSKSNTTATKEESKPTLIPKLRFPEFRGDGEWEESTLGMVARLKNGYAFKSSDYVESGQFQVITIANVQQGALALEAVKRIAQPPADIQAHQKLRFGDILISMTGNVGRVCRVTCDSLLLNQRVGKLIPEEIDPEFFYHSLQRDEFRNAMQLKSAGGAQGNLSAGDITEYPLHRPADDAEQRKIASCLSSLDNLISSQARKVDLLKKYKKGLLQQLFPREGETEPRLRFPEFRGTGAWENLALGERADILTGFPFDGVDISQDKNGVRLLRGINIAEGRIRHNADIDRYYTGSTIGLEKFRLRTNDLVIGMDGSKVGKNSALISESESESLLVQRVARLRAKPNALIRFIFHRIHAPTFHAYVDRVNTSSGIPHISAKQIQEYRISFPAEAEQKRITDLLGFIDDGVAAHERKLETLKTHKKGLMQGLFPNTDGEAE